MFCKAPIWSLCVMLLLIAGSTQAQTLSANDTIRLGAIVENGQTFPIILLDEYEIATTFIDPAERQRRDRLRNDIYVVYPYAIAAASVFSDIHKNLEMLDSRKERKRYLKTMNANLEHTFKEPLKNLSIDQGHILIKLINRQTGQNCYSIIKELKGGFNAVVWQSVGVLFNNNLAREYDPTDRDREVEKYVLELESSLYYQYKLSQQKALLRQLPTATNTPRPPSP